MDYVMSTFISTEMANFVKYFKKMACCHREIYRYGCMCTLYMDTLTDIDRDMDTEAWIPSFIPT